jgi:hypothetical protein
MPLANCLRCNRLFNRTLHEVCTDCRETEDDAYARLADYLPRHPEENLEQVAEGVGLDPELIRRMVQSGRLVGFDALALSVLACQRCGTPVATGRFCGSCQRALREGFSSTR